jgi:hypothetical protein
MDAVNGLVFGYDQAPDIALKLREGVRRKDRRKPRRVMTHNFRDLD